MNDLTHVRYVLHSPYPGGAWRGIEKCLCTEEGVLLVFNTEEEAKAYRAKNLDPSYWWVFEVTLTVPRVGEHRR